MFFLQWNPCFGEMLEVRTSAYLLEETVLKVTNYD